MLKQGMSESAEESDKESEEEEEEEEALPAKRKVGIVSKF